MGTHRDSKHTNMGGGLPLILQAECWQQNRVLELDLLPHMWHLVHLSNFVCEHQLGLSNQAVASIPVFVGVMLVCLVRQARFRLPLKG